MSLGLDQGDYLGRHGGGLVLAVFVLQHSSLSFGRSRRFRHSGKLDNLPDVFHHIRREVVLVEGDIRRQGGQGLGEIAVDVVQLRTHDPNPLQVFLVGRGPPVRGAFDVLGQPIRPSRLEPAVRLVLRPHGILAGHGDVIFPERRKVQGKVLGAAHSQPVDLQAGRVRRALRRELDGQINRFLVEVDCGRITLHEKELPPARCLIDPGNLVDLHAPQPSATFLLHLVGFHAPQVSRMRQSSLVSIYIYHRAGRTSEKTGCRVRSL